MAKASASFMSKAGPLIKLVFISLNDPIALEKIDKERDKNGKFWNATRMARSMGFSHLEGGSRDSAATFTSWAFHLLELFGIKTPYIIYHDDGTCTVTWKEDAGV